MTFTAFIEYYLTQGTRKNTKSYEKLSLLTYGKGGLNNQVNLDNSKSLIDLIEKN